MAPDLLNRDFTATRPDQKWLADITYIPTSEGWLFLAGINDVFSRKLVGWSMRDNLEAEIVADAIAMAVARRQPKDGVIHHSDRGSQLRLKGSSQQLFVRVSVGDRRELRRGSSSRGSCVVDR